MTLIILSLVASVVLLVATFKLAKSRHGLAGVCWLNGISVVTVCLFSLPALFLQSLGTLLVAAACGLFKLGPKSVLAGSIAATIGSYWLLIWISLPVLRERQELLEDYPLESMTERLDYESERLPGGGTDSAATVLAANVEQRLDRFEALEAPATRTYMLQALHERTIDQFVLGPGFGWARMARYSIEHAERYEAPRILLPAQELCDAVTGELTTRLEKPRPADDVRPTSSALLGMHVRSLEEIFDRDRMGYIKDRDHVAGFLPHRFQTMPHINRPSVAKPPWHVVRLELVSLLKHETPVAYVTEHLPQMDQLHDAPTRPLDEFEQKVIDRLRTDEDLVIDDRPGRIRMVGSLRAAKNCLECHQARRGELLGAFSYEMVPERE